MHVTTILGLLVGRVFGPTLLLLLTILSPSHVLAQTAGGAAETAGTSVTTPVPVFGICDPPPVCFASVEARQAWAAQNRCRFLEDVCTQTTPENDHRGAQQEDRGFWGNLWHGIESQLVYGYEFVKGLLTGLKDQVADLFSLVTNIDEAVQGLVALGRAFHDDPHATLRTLAGLLGQAAVDTITRATHCGAYDLGRVVGQHVNPAVMLRLATRLSRYGDDLGAAVNATRHDFGCASFAVGTSVLTDRGRVPIEQIRIGQIVLSRDGRSQTDIPRPVTDVFSRTASSHRILRTEYDTFRVTDEHPFWVQGKGWTQAKDVTDEDIIAGREGDALVLSNQEVKQALKVFNFSVADTASYFVGDGGSWAHNASCALVPGGGLAAHEAAGGHAIARHVGRTEQQLRARFEDNPRMKISSTFVDRVSAERFVSAAINAEQERVREFVASGRPSLTIDYVAKDTTGISVQRGIPGIVHVNGVRIVLIKAPSMPDGYLILTAYPQP